MRANKNPCRACLHFRICYERRGKCKEFITREEVQEQIEYINQAYRARAANAEQGVQEAPLARDGDGQIHNGFTDELQTRSNL